MRAEEDYGGFLGNHEADPIGQRAMSEIGRVHNGRLSSSALDYDLNLVLKPEEMTLQQFNTLRIREEARVGLVRALRKYEKSGFGNHADHAKENAKLVMLSLVIESIRGPASRGAFQVLEKMSQNRRTQELARPYLNLARQLRENSIARHAPPQDLSPFQSLRPRHLPRVDHPHRPTEPAVLEVPPAIPEPRNANIARPEAQVQPLPESRVLDHSTPFSLSDGEPDPFEDFSQIWEAGSRWRQGRNS